MSRKKNLLFILGIPLIGILIALGVYLLFPKEKPSSSSGISQNTASFESNFYDYLAQSLQEIFVNGGDSKALSEKISSLTDRGIGMIDEFIAQEKQEGNTLSKMDYDRLEQLRFYIYSSITIDEEKSRNSLNRLPNAPSKLSLLYSYIETFAKPSSRPQTSDKTFQDFLQEQKSWAETFEKGYDNKIVMLQFKANPIGKEFPNHLAKYRSTDGQDLNLKAFRGQYVLLDFWATWCLPCIAELPYLQEAYQTFHDQGFEIISVSLDNNQEAFQDFISDRNIPWIQYYDGKGFRGELVRDYEVSGIPTLYLIDRQGETISVNPRGEELLRILKSLLDS